MKRLFAYLLTLGLLLSACAPQADQTKAFTDLNHEYIADVLKQDYLTYANYTNEDEAYGVKKDKLKIDLVTETDAHQKDMLNRLHQINRTHLSVDQQVLYDQMERSLMLEKIEDQSQMLVLGTLDSDVFALYSQLQQFNTEIDGWQDRLIEYMSQWDDALQDLSKQADSHIKKHQLVIPWNQVKDSYSVEMERGLDSPEVKLILEKLDDTHREQFLSIYENEAKPACVRFVEHLEQLSQQGVYESPYEKASERQLLKKAFGWIIADQKASYKEVKKELKSFIYKMILRIQSDEQTDDLNQTYSLDDLAKLAKKHFPKVDMVEPTHLVLDPDYARAKSILGYYSQPVYESKAHSMATMEEKTPENLTTLVHEGVPGHFYQFLYYQQHKSRDDYITFLASDNLYHIEGWATYVSHYFVDDVLNEPAVTFSQDYYDLSMAITNYIDLTRQYEGIFDQKKLAKRMSKELGFEFSEKDIISYDKPFRGLPYTIYLSRFARDGHPTKAYHQLILDHLGMDYQYLRPILQKH